MNEAAAAGDYRRAFSAKSGFPEKKDAERRLKLIEADAGGAPKSDGG